LRHMALPIAYHKAVRRVNDHIAFFWFA